MTSHRKRSLLFAAIALATVWLVALGGNAYFKSRRVTVDQVAAYLRATDLDKLPADQRRRALRELAGKITALPFEDRRKARMDEEWQRWFAAMSDAEKGEFIEATLPSGFKQMLGSFEKLPEDKRRKAINDAIRDLKRARDELATAGPEDSPFRLGTNRPPPLSEELQQKVLKIGLKSYYSEASAQSKAELAPLLEELQQAMESGRLFRIHGPN